MKKLLLIILLILGCVEPISWENITHNPNSDCSDPKATNYCWWWCDIESPDYNPNKCQWESEDCEYCEDQYGTEEERRDNCCNISTAENYYSAYEWEDNFSQDSTYCIFEIDEDEDGYESENQECLIMPTVGECDGMCLTYYFHPDFNKCFQFYTSCCGTEAFDTMQDCIDGCE